VRPRRDVDLEIDLGAAWRVRGPNRVAVEKARAEGERDENFRVSGDACRIDPLGRADSISLVVMPNCKPAGGVLRSEDKGAAAINSGISSPSLRTTSFSFRSVLFSLRLLILRSSLTATPPRPCHGALRTATILGHNSDVADDICWKLTGPTAAEAAWKAIVIDGYARTRPLMLAEEKQADNSKETTETTLRIEVDDRCAKCAIYVGRQKEEEVM
jgi:hypothetical protein